MHTRITQLELADFRAIRAPLKLVLEDAAGKPLDRVLLAGPNGSGKTSCLEAILLALGREELIVRDLPPARREDHWRVEMPAGARVELHARSHPNKLDALLDHAGCSFSVLRTADRWEVREAGRVISDLAEVRKRLEQVEVEYFSSWRAPILPGGLQPTTSGRRLVDNEANRLRRLKQRIINERARRAFAHDPASADVHDVAWLRRLNAVWRAFHADGSTIEAGIVDTGADDPVFDLFVFDGEQRRCSIDQISSGELELVTMAGSLLFTSFAGLLVIDEPELHLHREWQTRLLDALTAMVPDAQLILATHADAPWDQAFSFERFFLAPPGDPRAGRG